MLKMRMIRANRKTIKVELEPLAVAGMLTTRIELSGLPETISVAEGLNLTTVGGNS